MDPSRPPSLLRWRGRKQIPFRYLMDGRLFRLLCASGQTAPIEGFRASLAQHRLAPEGRLPDLELTPLAVLDVVGLDPPPCETFVLPQSIRSEKIYMITGAVVKAAKDFFAKTPELQASALQKRVEEMREAADPAVHELIDLCLTRFVSREKFEEEIYGHLAFDYTYRFRFPEELREPVFEFLTASLFGTIGERVSGLSKMRTIKTLWDRSYERLLKKNPAARREIQALDREMKLRTYRDFLDWEVLHHSILGYGSEDRIQPVVAFTPDPEETVRLRCSAYKSALRAFLDRINREELENELRPRLNAWRPGLVVCCREDGTFDTPVATGELPVY